MENLKNEIIEELKNISDECLIDGYKGINDAFIKIEKSPEVTYQFIDLIMKMEEEMKLRGLDEWI